MARDNHKKTHQDNILRVATPIVLLKTDRRGRGTRQKHLVRLQWKYGRVIGSTAGKYPVLCIIVLGPHRDNQPIPSPQG